MLSLHNPILLWCGIATGLMDGAFKKEQICGFNAFTKIEGIVWSNDFHFGLKLSVYHLDEEFYEVKNTAFGSKKVSLGWTIVIIYYGHKIFVFGVSRVWYGPQTSIWISLCCLALGQISQPAIQS